MLGSGSGGHRTSGSGSDNQYITFSLPLARYWIPGSIFQRRLLNVEFHGAYRAYPYTCKTPFAERRITSYVNINQFNGITGADADTCATISAYFPIYNWAYGFIPPKYTAPRPMNISNFIMFATLAAFCSVRLVKRTNIQ